MKKDGAFDAVHGTTVVVNEREDARTPFTYLRRLRAVRGVDAKVLEDLHTELSLLREENARLRVERERTPDAGRVIERIRALPTSFKGEELGDEAWHLLTEGLVMRDSLIDVCNEIEQAMITLKGRLNSIVPALWANGLDHDTPASASRENGFLNVLNGSGDEEAECANGHAEAAALRAVSAGAQPAWDRTAVSEVGESDRNIVNGSACRSPNTRPGPEAGSAWRIGE